MPLAKVVKGGRGGWCRCDEYITEKEKARVLETNMAGDNPVERSMEYRLCIEKNLRASNTVLHISISPHPDDKIDDQMWCDIARGVRVGLGYQKNQYLFATHEDTGLRHGHLLINRVDVEGKVPTDWLDKRKTEKILRQLEEEFNLTPVTSSWEVAMRSPTTGQIQKAQKEQKQFVEGKRSSPPLPPVIMVLQEIISLATLDKPTLTELLDRLERQDVRTEIKRTPGGIIQGISFGKDGEKFRGSKLNREFSWNGLQKYRGVSVDLVRDAQAIDAAVNRRRETEQLQELDNGTQGTAKAGSQTASRGTSSSDVSKRRSKGASRSSSSTEPAALQSDEGEFRIEAAVSQLNRSTEQLTTAASQLNESARHFARRLEQVDKLSREHTKQPSRNLAVAPNGAGSKSGGSGEDTGNNRQLVAGQLDQFGAAVHEFNAELEAQPVRHQAAGDGSRTESREARASNSTTSSTTGWSAADVHRQFEEINRIHDGIKQKRRGAVIELEKDLAETFNQLDTESLKSTETKSRLTAAQTQWESSPVWQERSDWERNMITAAFEELKTSDFGLNEMKGAKFGNGQYKAYLVNFTSLYIFCETLPITSYSSYRDSLAHECTLTPQHQQYFLPPVQRLENSQEIESPAQLGFFDSHRTPSSSKPIEISNTTNAPNRPSPKLQLPKNKEARPAYLDKIYQRLAAEVRKVSSGIPIEALDVGIATLAYEEGYSSSDVRCILLRSPKSKDFQQSPDLFDKFSEYIEQRKAISLTERQLFHDPVLKKRVEIVKPIIEEFCKDLADGKQIGGTGYTMKLNGDSRTIIAHDGRGEVLKLTGRWVEHCELTDNDVEFFQKAAAQLAEFDRQYRQRMRDSTNKPNRTQKQMEL